MDGLEIKIVTKIKKARRGSLFFAEDFVNYGSSKAVSKALERLVKSNEISRVARGIYARLENDPVIGAITPGIDAIAISIAKRDKARIVPTGTYALNRLGLSTQVPLNVVYLTDGATRKVKVGNRTITFKHASPKNVSTIGELSTLAIQALRTIGREKVTTEEITKIQQILENEKPTHLQYDYRLAPEWIRKIIQPVLKQI